MPRTLPAAVARACARARASMAELAGGSRVQRHASAALCAVVVLGAVLGNMPQNSPRPTLAGASASSSAGYGGVWGWGYDASGQLGNGSAGGSQSSPVPATGTTNFTAISTGASFGLGISTSGNVWAWGDNAHGELGTGTLTASSNPVEVCAVGQTNPCVSFLSNITAIAVGGAHAVAVDAGGNVYTWGNDGNGQLGNGVTGTDATVPVQVKGVGGVGTLAGITTVSAGTGDSYALSATGNVYAWGHNNAGQLGNNTTSDSANPVEVLTGAAPTTGCAVTTYLCQVRSIAGSGSNLAAVIGGTVYEWGANDVGELGQGTTDASAHATPLEVKVGAETGCATYLCNVNTIAAGGSHTLALIDGNVWAWGSNSNGQLGINNTTTSSSPVEVLVGAESGCTTNLCNVSAIAAGSLHSEALVNGNVFTWGANSSSQLGNGNGSDSWTPTEVVGNGGTGNISNVSAIARGSSSTSALAIVTNATMESWGYNGHNTDLGNGDGSGTNTLGPTLVVGTSGTGQLSGVVSIAGSEAGGAALLANGTVYTWGDDTNGQLGDGSHGCGCQEDHPVQVHAGAETGCGTYLCDIVAIADGGVQNDPGSETEATALALTASGAVFSWGYGPIGDTTAPVTWGVPTATQVCAVGQISTPCSAYIAHVIGVSAGGDDSYALNASGNLYSWGQNGSGELGNNTTTASYAPVEVLTGADTGCTTYLCNITAVSSNNSDVWARSASGGAWSWGYNFDGELGNKSTTSASTPVKVVNASNTPLTGVTAVGSMLYAGAALIAGNVYTWGSGGTGELGNNTFTSIDTAVEVLAGACTGCGTYLANVTSLAVSQDTAIAVTTASGTAYAWGNDQYGELGDGGTTAKAVPVSVNASPPVTAISMMMFSGFAITGTPGPPTITSVSPGVGLAGGGTVVVVSGTNFISVSAVKFGSTAAATPTAVTPTQLNVYSPPGAAGSVDVTVTTPLGTSATGAGDRFTYVNAGLDGWGGNGSGQLGNGTSGGNQATPVAVTGGLNFKAVAGGASFTVGLTTTGNVYAWGDNSYGELGNGTTSPSSTPVEVLLGSDSDAACAIYLCDVVAVAAGDDHALAVTASGAVFAWGWDDFGELGDNNAGVGVQTSSPSQVKGVGGVGTLAAITSVAAGAGDSYALSASGHVYAWGHNNYGQLGQNNQGDSHTPVEVLVGAEVGCTTYLCNAEALSGSGNFAAALVNGNVFSWGRNDQGQLGQGTTTATGCSCLATPVEVHVGAQAGCVTYLCNVKSIATGSGHTLALVNGNVFAWGSNSNGQLGINSTTNQPAPVEVLVGSESGCATDLCSVFSIATGSLHSLVVANGNVYSWGGNANSQLGDNVAGDSHLPVEVVGVGGASSLLEVGSLASGSEMLHSEALVDAATIDAWGYDNYGQIDNSYGSNPQILPVEGLGPGGSGLLNGVSSIAAGWGHGVASTADGSVFIWGYNNTSTAAAVPGPGGSGSLSGIVAVAADSYTSAALTASGNVYAWGNELGNGTGSSSATPVEVCAPGQSSPCGSFLSNIVSVAGNGSDFIAVSATGNAYAWGDDTYAQLGQNGTNSFTVPVEVKGVGGSGFLANITAAGMASNTAVARTASGNAYDWGYNVDGEVGNATTTSPQKSPVEVCAVGQTSPCGSFLGNITSVTGFGNNPAAVSGGNVFTWGLGSNGTLGNGGTANTSVPVEVCATTGCGSFLGNIGGTGGSQGNGLAVSASGIAYTWGPTANGAIGNGTNGTPTQYSTPVQITLPAGVTAAALGSSDGIVIDQAPAPSVTSLSPAHGGTVGGTSVVITGQNLVGATAVSFGAIAASSYTVTSPTRVVAIAPAESLGTVDVRVSNVTGQSTVNQPGDQYTYAIPSVSSISPNHGTVAGGTTVTITGSNFEGASAVSFGTVAAASFTLTSSTTISATSPAESAGWQDVTVTSPGGTSTTGVADQFYFAGQPSITSLTPSSGPVGGGTEVFINGTGFSGVSAVTFGATAATSFTLLSDTRVAAIAPAESAGMVDVSLTSWGGTTVASAADHYTYGSVCVGTVTRMASMNQTVPQGQLTGTVALSATNVWAIGFGSNAYYNGDPFAEQWNGTTWTTFTLPHSASGDADFLYGIGADSANDVWAVGRFSNNSSGASGPIIYHFDGTSWSVFNSPSLTQAQLSAVVAYSSGSIWAVGEQPGGTLSQATLVEQYNSGSQTWSVVATPNEDTSSYDYNSLVSVSADSATDVWAAGSATAYSNSATKPLALHYNGSTWALVTPPNPGGTNPEFGAVVAVSPTNVFFVGSNENCSGTCYYQTLAYSYNGSIWSSNGGKNAGSAVSNQLLGVTAVSSNNIWAVGYYYNSSTSTNQTLTEQWNGSSWAIVASTNSGSAAQQLNGVVSAGGSSVWAVGQVTNGSLQNPMAEQYTTAWQPASVLGTPGITETNNLTAIAAVSSTDVWAVGRYTNYGGDTQPLAEHWNGSTWSIVLPPPILTTDNEYLAGVAAVSSTNVTAVGYAAQYQSGCNCDVDVPIVSSWNGTSWTTSLAPGAILGTNVSLLAVTALPGSSTLYAAGYSGANPLIEVGTYGGGTYTWSVSGSLPSGAGYMTAISADSTTDVWAAGYFFTGTGYLPRVLHYNGTTWSIVSVPAAYPSASAEYDYIYAVVAIAANDVILSGYTEYVVGSSVYYNAYMDAYNGSSWTYDPGAAAGYVNPVEGLAASSPTDVLGVGYFGATGAAAVQHSVGSTWQLDSGSGTGVLAGVTAIGGGSYIAVGTSSNQTLIEEYSPCSAPTVTSISPATGSPSGGTSVTVNGTGFTGATAVSFGSAGATYTFVSDTQLTATSPAGTGTVDVRVTTNNGQSAVNAPADQFTFGSGLLSIAAPGALNLGSALAPGSSLSNVGLGDLGFTNTLNDGSSWTVTVAATDLYNGANGDFIPFTSLGLGVGQVLSPTGPSPAGAGPTGFSGSDASPGSSYSSSLTLVTGTAAQQGTWTQSGNSVNVNIPANLANSGTMTGTIQYTITG